MHLNELIKLDSVCKDVLMFILCECAFACIYVCALHVCSALCGWKEGTRSSGTEVTDSLQLPWMLGTQLWSSAIEEVLLSMEPSLQFPVISQQLVSFPYVSPFCE